ncbi:MAG: hypothetical protein IT372_12295 [Polyangiaceae bacterium]|nr:hypothetical protein [Polyangiaceae bacterium]
MSRRDVLDEEMALKFRWRTSMPAETAAPPAAEPEPFAEEAGAEGEAEEGEAREEVLARWERAARGCAELSRHVERAWQAPLGGAQAEATAALLARVDALGFDIVGMREHPAELVRLWRLLVRHYAIMPRSLRRSGSHTLSYAPLSPGEREVADLLVEAAEAGDGWIAFLLEQAIEGELIGRRLPQLGARLARILDSSDRWSAREIAARWLSFAEPGEALPALRRALRQPSARTRWIALDVLLDRTPVGVGPDDVLWLLEDAVRHPLPRGLGSRSFETALNYEETLIQAVTKAPPPEGFRPLEIIADGGGAHIRKERAALDAGWAMRALAAGYVERALPWIDRALASARAYRRWDAVEAAGLLPDELARPRLLEAAICPDHRSRERACELWFKRFGAACPAGPLDGLRAELLPDGPAERLLSRLTVLRGASDEARGAMLEALIAEAPPPRDAGAPAMERADLTEAQREALALLLYSLRDHTGIQRRPSLPTSEEKWAELLVARFGAPAFDGIADLAARGAMAGVDHEWLGALAGLARRGLLRDEWKDRLREIARAAVCSPAWDGATSPVHTLAVVGAPPELLDRLWSIVTTPTDEDAPRHWRWAYAIHWALDALVRLKDAPELDARVAAEGAEALRMRHLEKLGRLVLLGWRRRSPEVLALAERCLAALDEDPGLIGAAVQCAHALDDAGRIDDGWLLAALRAPDSPRFAVAARLSRKRTSPDLLEALEGALGSPARNGTAAAEAAEALVLMKAISREDPRLDGILERAPDKDRASLAGALVFHGAPVSSLRRHFLATLTSPDDEAASRAFEDLYARPPAETEEIFEAALAMSPPPPVRERLERRLGKPSETELYWRETDEDEDDEGDEGDEESE